MFSDQSNIVFITAWQPLGIYHAHCCCIVTTSSRCLAEEGEKLCAVTVNNFSSPTIHAILTAAENIPLPPLPSRVRKRCHTTKLNAIFISKLFCLSDFTLLFLIHTVGISEKSKELSIYRQQYMYTTILTNILNIRCSENSEYFTINYLQASSSSLLKCKYIILHCLN